MTLSEQHLITTQNLLYECSALNFLFYFRLPQEHWCYNLHIVSMTWKWYLYISICPCFARHIVAQSWKWLSCVAGWVACPHSKETQTRRRYATSWGWSTSLRISFSAKPVSWPKTLSRSCSLRTQCNQPFTPILMLSVGLQCVVALWRIVLHATICSAW